MIRGLRGAGGLQVAGATPPTRPPTKDEQHERAVAYAQRKFEELRPRYEDGRALNRIDVLALLAQGYVDGAAGVEP